MRNEHKTLYYRDNDDACCVKLSGLLAINLQQTTQGYLDKDTGKLMSFIFSFYYPPLAFFPCFFNKLLSF